MCHFSGADQGNIMDICGYMYRQLDLSYIIGPEVLSYIIWSESSFEGASYAAR